MSSPRRSVLTINAGSSSVRLDCFVWRGGIERAASRHDPGNARHDPSSVLRSFLDELNLEKPDAVIHRVVHGGEAFSQPTLIDTPVEDEIEALSDLAPLHNPVALGWIRQARSIVGDDVPQVAAFDTAFYHRLPAVARAYALPSDLSAAHGLRRYGFHGLAHQAMIARWRTLHPERDAPARVISLQLGSGCSVTASQGGQPMDTSMGFSPAEGLVMSTRCGDVDPEIVTHLARHGVSADEISHIINHQSGLLGVSGISGDMRTLVGSDDDGAALAVRLYAYRVRKYIGAYAAALGGVDAVLFGGGVGEHAPEVRQQVMDGMGWLGIHLDPSANTATVGEEGMISREDSAVAVMVIPVDEAFVMVHEAARVMGWEG